MKIIGYWAIDKSGYSEDVDKPWTASYPIEFSAVRDFPSVEINRIKNNKFLFDFWPKCGKMQ